jgi:hypothetical protein
MSPSSSMSSHAASSVGARRRRCAPTSCDLDHLTLSAIRLQRARRIVERDEIAAANDARDGDWSRNGGSAPRGTEGSKGSRFANLTLRHRPEPMTREHGTRARISADAPGLRPKSVSLATVAERIALSVVFVKMFGNRQK